MHVRDVGREFEARASGFTLWRHLTNTTQLLTHFSLKFPWARATSRRVYRLNPNFFDRQSALYSRERRFVCCSRVWRHFRSCCHGRWGGGVHRPSLNWGRRRSRISEEIQPTSWCRYMVDFSYLRIPEIRHERQFAICVDVLKFCFCRTGESPHLPLSRGGHLKSISRLHGHVIQDGGQWNRSTGNLAILAYELRGGRAHESHGCTSLLCPVLYQ